MISHIFLKTDDGCHTKEEKQRMEEPLLIRVKIALLSPYDVK